MSTEFDSNRNGDRWKGRLSSGVDYTEYDDFKTYLRDVADALFPFSTYHDYQDEILYEVLEAYLIDDYLNVIVEGPTGIGKSAINVTVAQVLGEIASKKQVLEPHFGINLRHLNDGSAFYTTPQRSLRNQLAEDDDLKHAVAMLKARQDYICGATGENCSECPVNKDSEDSCRGTPGCTYWDNKMDSIQNHVAVITFAMLIVDHYLPGGDDQGRLSFKDRDLVIVDEGHGAEQQSASLFAGFELSPWNLPNEVYRNLGEKVSWDEEKFGNVEEELRKLKRRMSHFIEEHQDDESRHDDVEDCEDLKRKLDYALTTHEEGRGWVVNVEEVGVPQGSGVTKKLQVKPVRVDEFLDKFIWSRGRRHLITSATIPFRANIKRWADRIGLSEDVKFISKRTPFPEEHRLIHLNTVVGEMSGDSEEENWDDAVEMVKKIHSHHEGEKGLIHCVSYPRGEKLAESLDRSNVVLDDESKDTSALIDKWQNSDRDIMISPAMTEGVDLHGDKCRWQVLLKVPFAHVGDSRVSYLLQEKKQWNWYYESAMIDIIQAVGRAVRGPEPEEAASFYILDKKISEVMSRTNPPEYFADAIRYDAPDHWEDPDAAPWR